MQVVACCLSPVPDVLDAPTVLITLIELSKNKHEFQTVIKIKTTTVSSLGNAQSFDHSISKGEQKKAFG